MSGGDAGVLAPQALMVPRASEQLVSGALYISGGKLYFTDYESSRPKLVTST